MGEVSRVPNQFLSVRRLSKSSLSRDLSIASVRTCLNRIDIASVNDDPRGYVDRMDLSLH